MTGYVYAMLSESGLVKVGWSGDPVRRLAKVNSDTASPASLIGCVPGTRADESALLHLLAPYRSHGSWFHRGSAPVEALLEMMPKPVPRSVDDLTDGLRAYLKKNNIKQSAFAQLVGVKQPTITRYIKGQRFPRREHLEKINAVTGGAVTANDFLEGTDWPADVPRPTADTEAA